nr:hypothetical protein BaRGS_005934 [Batillaria attramentaria]
MHVTSVRGQAGFAIVSEVTNIGEFVALVTVDDPDSEENGITSCQLDNYHFSLMKLDDNSYKIVTARRLDRENMPSYNVIIACRDGGSPSLSTSMTLNIEVADENDNAPVFTQAAYFFNVGEHERIGTEVGRVSARDNDIGDNARLTYGMEIDDDGDLFTIDRITGDIYTSRVLETEVHSQLTFRVVAYDRGSNPLTGTTTVVVKTQGQIHLDTALDWMAARDLKGDKHTLLASSSTTTGQTIVD